MVWCTWLPHFCKHYRQTIRNVLRRDKMSNLYELLTTTISRTNLSKYSTQIDNETTMAEVKLRIKPPTGTKTKSKSPANYFEG